ncbi:MAG TPA: hypothetical protein VNL14_13945 [Candidatus Acidoferrales bacterium]|nr:hypothetical protein [Candidatus Acidoferrales bacterium]
MGRRIGIDRRDIILSSLAGKTGAEARAIIEDLAERFGISPGHVYRISQSVRATGRAARSDIGARRLTISEEQLQWLKSLTANYDLTAEAAVGLAELNNVIPPGTLNPATYNGWLRRQGISRRRLKTDVKPVHEFEAGGPNAIHQFDTTKLEQLHYDRQTDTLSWNPRANRKNSRGEKPDAIWLYSLVDDYSRCKFALLYRSLNQYNHLDFLFHAWSEKPNPAEFPFYGIPQHIYIDNGGGNQGTKFRVALKKLGVHIIPTDPSYDTPHAARKRGKIESVFKLYNEWLKLFQIRPMTWAEACESLYQFVLSLNRRTHSVTQASPFARWLEIGKPQHTPSEELWRVFHYDHDTRVVYKNLTFSIDRHLYRLPERRPYIDWIDEKIDVYWLPGDYSKVYAVFRSDEIEVEENKAAIVRPAFSYPREEREATAVEAARAAAADQSYPGMKLYSTDPGRTAYLPRKGEAFDEKRIAEKTVIGADGKERPGFSAEKQLNKFEIILRLKSHGLIVNSPPSSAERFWVDSIMKGREQIGESELNRIVAEALERDLAEGQG